MAVPVSTSDVDLINRAFGKIDGRRIAATTDTIKEGELARRYYAPTLDEMLGEHPWRFATTRVSLTGTTALDGWDYAFTLPSNFLRLVELAGNENFYGSGLFPHHREGDLILTSHSIVWCRYVYQLRNVIKMPGLFQEAFCQRFASYVGPHLNRSGTMTRGLYEQSEITLGKAKSQEGSEESHEEFPESSWVTERY